MAPWKSGSGAANKVSPGEDDDTRGDQHLQRKPPPPRPPVKADTWTKSVWKAAGQRVAQDIRGDKEKDCEGEGDKLSTVVHAAAVRSSAVAAKRLLAAVRDSQKKSLAAKGSRNVIFSSGYVYFLVLESSWLFTSALTLTAYSASIVFVWVMSLPLQLYNSQEDVDEYLSPHYLIALRFATAHVITMGFGTVMPTTDAGYAVAYFSMLVGVIVNVFVFSAVLAKFQSPQKDLVWSTRAVMSRRDGVPTLLVRVGNLRCHTLYNPSIRITLLTRHVTREGEGYMKKEDVECNQPATISGVHTIACPVVRESPLYEVFHHSKEAKACGDDDDDDEKERCKHGSSDSDSDSGSDSDDEDDSQWLLHVTFTATDPIYGAELCSSTTFTRDTLVGPARFKDVIGFCSKGKPMIDWHAFDGIKEGCWHAAEDDAAHGDAGGGSAEKRPLNRSTSLATSPLGRGKDAKRNVAVGYQRQGSPTHSDDSAQEKDGSTARSRKGGGSQPSHDGALMFGQQPAPAGPLVPGIPRKAVLSSRASYGSGDVIDGRYPKGPLMPFCPYCHRIGLLLAEAGVPFETYLIDGRDKAEWFLEAFPAGTTPSMQGSPGGVDSGEWVGGFDEILARAKEQHAKFALVANDDGAFKTAEVNALCCRLAFSQFAGVLAGTETEAGKGMVGGLMSMGMIEAVEGESGAETRKRLIEMALETYLEVEKMLSSLAGPFIGGDAPNQADAFMATMLFWSHNALESGLSPVPQAPCKVGDVGAPSIRTYLERWTARPSWKECYKTASMYSASTMMSAVKMAVDMAPDVCNDGKDMYVVMERARRLDVGYREAVGLEDGALMFGQQPAPVGPLVPGIPRKAVLSSRASYGSGDVIDGRYPKGPLMPFCPYCHRIGLLLAEAGVPFETYLIDGRDKAEWFLEAFPAGTTPSMQGSPGGVDSGEWVGGFDEILARAKEQHAKFALVANDDGAFKTAEVNALCCRLAFSQFAGVLAGTETEAGKGMVGGLMSMGMIEAVEGESGAETRKRLIEMALETYLEVEKMLSSLAGPFIGGDAPNQADAFMATMLFWSHNALESGLSPVPQAPCKVGDVGAPSIRTYLERWTARPSWKECYKTASMYSASTMMSAVKMAVDMAPDVCNDGKDMYVVMERARRLDVGYREAVGLEDGALMFGQQPAPVGPLVPGIPRKAVLSSRASYGSGDVIDGRYPKGPLMPFCPYCHRIGLLLAEAGVPFETYLIDGRDKAEWFLEAFPAGTTPSMQGSPGGVDSGEWVGGFDEILARAKEQHAKFALVANDDGAFKTAEVNALCCRLAFSQFAGVLAGTETEAGKGMVGGLMSMGMIEAVEGESGAETRKRLIEMALETYLEVEKMLSSLAGPFIGGDAPNQADAFMATMLFWSHNALESGLSPVPQAPCKVGDVGAPSIRTYLERWTARPSWKECYKTASMYSASTMMSAVKMAVDMAPDVCNDGKDMYVVMERARRLDVGYREAVGLEDGALMFGQQPAPVGPLVPGIPRKAVLSSRASYGSGDVIDGRYPKGPLMPFCPYCHRIGLLLAEAGVPFETYLIDGRDKAEWFLEAFPAGTTPSMQGSPGGVDSGEWVGGFDEILARAKEQHAKFALVANDDGAFKTAEVNALCCRLAFSQFAGVLAGTETEAGKGMVGGLMSMGMIEAVEGESGAETRKRLIEMALETYLEVEKMLSSLAGPFIGGDAPNQADAFMATMLFWSHNALESGLSPVPQAPCKVGDVGAPSIRTYLERWTARPSWKECYKTASMYSASTMMSAVKMAVDMAPDVCNDGKDMYVVMARARRLDATYLEHVGAYRPGFLPPSDPSAEETLAPLGVPFSGAPRVAVLASRGSDGEGDAVDGDSPEGPLMPYCTYCIRLCLILAEARVPFELVMVDQATKPRWFTQAYPPAMTPSMQGTPGGVDGGEWVGGFDALLERATGQNRAVAAAARQRGPLTLKQAKRLGARLTSALVGSRLIGTAAPAGQAFSRECLENAGVSAEQQRGVESEEALRRLLAKAAADAVAEIETHIRAGGSSSSSSVTSVRFMAGDDPDAADALLATVLLVAHNLAESGVALSPGSPAGQGFSLASIGGPSLEPYLRLWSSRPSWLVSYRTTSIRSAAAIRPTVATLASKAPDVCDAAAMLACMNRARAADPLYAEASEEERKRRVLEDRRSGRSGSDVSASSRRKMKTAEEEKTAAAQATATGRDGGSRRGGGDDYDNDGNDAAGASRLARQSSTSKKEGRMSSSKVGGGGEKKKLKTAKSKTNAVICI